MRVILLDRIFENKEDMFQEIFDKKSRYNEKSTCKKERVMKYEIGRKRNIESNEKNKIFKKWN